MEGRKPNFLRRMGWQEPLNGSFNPKDLNGQEGLKLKVGNPGPNTKRAFPKILFKK